MPNEKVFALGTLFALHKKESAQPAHPHQWFPVAFD